MCCNMYRSAPLHAGYTLLNRWAEEAQQRLPASTEVQPCWVYTSNVDGVRPAVLFVRCVPSEQLQVFSVVAARWLGS
jgi:hypothetical protein